MIRVRAPREIDEYKEKILFGLSFRQLICGLIAVVLGVGSYLLCTKVFAISADIASYIVIVLAAPPLAIGFVRIKGMFFEDYARQFYEWQSSPKRKLLIYEYQTEINEEKEAIKSRKKNLKKETLNEAIYTGPDFSKKAVREKWQDAKRYIEEA